MSTTPVQHAIHHDKALGKSGNMHLQVGFTALSLGLNTSDSSEKQKWLEAMRKENDKMVCCLLSYFMLSL